MSTISITAARAYIEDDVPAIAVKISGQSYELNIWLQLPDVERLRDVKTAPWADGSIRAGTSANAPAFWSCDRGAVFVGVGHDDETWDFGISTTMADFHALLAEIERELGAPRPARRRI